MSIIIGYEYIEGLTYGIGNDNPTYTSNIIYFIDVYEVHGDLRDIWINVKCCNILKDCHQQYRRRWLICSNYFHFRVSSKGVWCFVLFCTYLFWFKKNRIPHFLGTVWTLYFSSEEIEIVFSAKRLVTQLEIIINWWIIQSNYNLYVNSLIIFAFFLKLLMV